MEIKSPYLLFLGDARDHLAVKTGSGIVDWRREDCVGQYRLEGCNADLELPDMDAGAACKAGAKTLVIGVVNPGGILPPHWVGALTAAMAAGLDIASGLHRPLASHPEIKAAAEKYGTSLHDVRIPDQNFSTGNGEKRPGKRLLTVGTDCSIGKKYAALAVEAEMRKRGLDADFRATGQTGILITGRGVSIDAVVADFISGAAEWAAPAADDNHWDIVEGQGSLFHPAFSGVSLGLLHGSQPDAYIVCHEPTRTSMRNVKTLMPTIRQVMDLTETCGRITNPAIRCTGIAINTAALSETDARNALAAAEQEYALPACDPVRFGVEAIVDHLTANFC